MNKIFILLSPIFVILFFIRCDKFIPKYEERNYEVIIAKKYTENESINNFGAFRTNHYFLYTNGNLEDVELELYISSEIGDTIVKIENYRIE